MTGTDDISALILDQDIDRCRKQIGISRFSRSLPYNSFASFDATRRYAFSYGDDNPLWHDEGYARRTRWSGSIACPMFYVSTGTNLTPAPSSPDQKALFKGLFKGINKYYSGVTWYWWRPLLADTRVFEDYLLENMEVKESSSLTGRRTVLETFRRIYYDETGLPFAMNDESYVNAERGGSREVGKYNDLKRQEYAPEAIVEVDRKYAAEERRGATPRMWDEVTVGDVLVPVVKGPLSMVEVIAYHMGHGLSSYGIGPLRYNWALRQKMPAFFSRDRYGVFDVAQRVHWDQDRAVEVGFPAPYDYGQMRSDWIVHLITNWMGDDSWLCRLSLRTTGFNFHGDVTTCEGEVIDKRIEGGMHVVELTLRAINQRGQETATATALVSLPSETGPAVLPAIPPEVEARCRAIAADRITPSQGAHNVEATR